MIPRVDVKFLQQICRGMHESRLKVFRPAKMRSSQAIIMRFGGADGSYVSQSFTPADRDLTTEQILDRLEQRSTMGGQSSLQVLLVKRRHVELHRWSSHVGFPGGRRDATDDDDDLCCVHRWCRYTMGIPLESSDFVLLGRLPDFFIPSKNTGGGLMQARFVYLHIGDITPSVRMATYELEAVHWASLHRLFPENVSRTLVSHKLSHFIADYETNATLYDYFPGTHLRFPAVRLSSDEKHPVLAGAPLWGLPLTTLSTLLSLDGRPRLDWPLVTCNSTVIQWLFIHPWHFYMQAVGGEFVGNETVGYAAVGVSWQDYMRWHAPTLSVVGICLMCSAFILYWINIFSVFWLACYVAMMPLGEAQAEVVRRIEDERIAAEESFAEAARKIGEASNASTHVAGVPLPLTNWSESLAGAEAAKAAKRKAERKIRLEKFIYGEGPPPDADLHPDGGYKGGEYAEIDRREFR